MAPYGPGTYGTKKGRPVKSTTKKGTKKQRTRGDLTYHPRRCSLTYLQMITTEYGKQNMFATEPPLEVLTMNDNAELQNGRWAMIGIMAAMGAYATTGQIIPVIF